MTWNWGLKAACAGICMVVLLAAAENELTLAGTGVVGDNRGRGAFVVLTGEFRAVAANLLWLKVDKYHHEYAERHANWTEDSDVMPLIRLITMLDPHFAEAYLTGAWMLATGLNRVREAEAFVREGIRNNPRNAEMHSELAILYARRSHNLKLALVEARQAVRLAKDPFQRENAERLCRAIERDIGKR